MNVVLSYGLGADSTALLLRWLTEPASRDFDLDQLLVVTAMTGDERRRTGPLIEQHVLPRLRRAGVRYAQVARAGPRQADGIRVLDDSTSPGRLYVEGAYTLEDELTAAGTAPQASGRRLCSMKFKGWVIDRYIADYSPTATRHFFGYEVGEKGRAMKCARLMPGRLVFGFEMKERGRAGRATEYDTAHRVAEFPLIQWGWTRSDCERYIESVTGVNIWPKSACYYCPFSLTSRDGRVESLRRYDDDPESAIETLRLEWRALCLNERSGLIAGDRFIDFIAEHRPRLADTFWSRLDRAPHAVYRVRRHWEPRADDPTRATVSRTLDVVMVGSRIACSDYLRTCGPVDRHDGIERVYQHRRAAVLPTREEFIVAGPIGAQPKPKGNRLASFERRWNETASRNAPTPVGTR